jgi:hypothetical protein
MEEPSDCTLWKEELQTGLAGDWGLVPHCLSFSIWEGATPMAQSVLE